MRTRDLYKLLDKVNKVKSLSGQSLACVEDLIANPILKHRKIRKEIFNQVREDMIFIAEQATHIESTIHTKEFSRKIPNL